MSELTRKDFLKLLGAGGVAITIAPGLALESAEAQGVAPVTPVRVPHPLPIYGYRSSFLPTGLNGAGQILDPGTFELSSYRVIDDVIVPPECERYTILKWGDQVFVDEAEQITDDYFGYNNDFTAYVPIQGRKMGWLVINHEYISYPFHQYAPVAPSRPDGYPLGPAGRSFETVIGNKIGLMLPDAPVSNDDRILLYGEFMYNVGLSVVRITRLNNHYRPAKVAGNRRVTGLSGLALNAGRGYPTSWGSLPHQQGNDDFIRGTGPAATEVFSKSSDGLGSKIIGTFANCSGGATPWGTVLSCEENFQGDSTAFVGVTETVKPDGTQTAYTTGTVGELFGLVGEKYGWVVEVDPRVRTGHAKKHTALGRFRHENIAIRTQAGNPLVCYIGDDRRGGHWWKFVSAGTLVNPKDEANSTLFTDGTLHVARFNSDGTGRWIPLTLRTPTDPVDPADLFGAGCAAGLRGPERSRQAAAAADHSGGAGVPRRHAGYSRGRRLRQRRSDQ
jgi:secreted PhoX family phosphatase